MRHLSQLDGLRAVAVAMVIVSHWAPGRDAFWFNGGIGVQLFFTISGFLITGILLDAREQAERGGVSPWFVLRRFYVRRFLRIFPLFYATLAVMFVLGVPSVRETIGWHLAYLTNVLMALRGDWYREVSHLWSLAVEEQFYLVWPWLMLLAPRRWLPGLIVACIVTAPLFRALGAHVFGLNEVAVVVLPLASLDTLGIGALYAWLLRRRRAGHDPLADAARWATALGVAGLCGFLLGHLVLREVLPRGWAMGISDAMLAPMALGVVHAAARGLRGPVGALLQWSPVRYLGKISYGVYVLHFFVPPLTQRALQALGVQPEPTLGAGGLFALNLAVLVAAASASWHLFESPINDLKRHFPYVPEQAPAPRTASSASSASSSPPASPFR